MQNSMARVVTGLARYANITPVLAGLHWLPVEYRIQFKIAVTTFKVLATHKPTYLADIIRLYTPSRNSGKNLLQDTRSWPNDLFCHAAPTVWISLPQHLIADLSSITIFKRLLKTEFNHRSVPSLIRDCSALAILHSVNINNCVKLEEADDILQ